MSADTPSWRELANFEHCEPTPLAFRALVALLDTWPADDQSSAIAHADKLLGRWPDEARLAPWSWCRAASKGAVPPTWRLVRALQLTSGHLSKGTVNLGQLAHHATARHVTELTVPQYSKFQELSFLYHRPEAFPDLKKLRAVDKRDDGDVRALAASPLWRTLESFEIDSLTASLVHCADASRIVPQLDRPGKLRHLTLRSPDLIAAWDANELPQLCSASVFIRSIEEAATLAAREELSRLTSLSIAFRCGFSGSSPFEPFLGNIIEADEAAAEAFFSSARLDRLEHLAIFGYSMGYWGREGLGSLGLEALIDSGWLQRLKHLRLELLPLGDKGIAALAPALGKELERLELVNVYCKGPGAAALLESPCLSSLRHLDLSANRIAAEPLAKLAEVDLPHLQSLDLGGPSINPYYWNIGQQPLLDTGAMAWGQSRNAPQLKSLRLPNCHLTDDALAAIFQSPRLRKLEQLELSHNSFTASAISRSVVDSPLWQSLRDLGLNDCRLDTAGIEALTRVKQAPALRSLALGYNSIGPRGAAALANWAALANVWQLDLHDNFIGNEGLIALANSLYLGRLVELDLEQDCWNSRTFTFDDDAARALAASPGLARLDSLFSGCVDEYHGAAYSPGFTKAGLELVRRAAWARPAFRASCSDFSTISDYIESGEFDEAAATGDQDFRAHPFVLNEKEAEGSVRSMHQIRSSAHAETVDEQAPPRILPALTDFDDDDDDGDDDDEIEGIGFRDPRPTTDRSLAFDLSLEDSERPLPVQVGKFLVDTLGSIFQATAVGYFDTSGSSSRQDEDGRYIPTDQSFHVGLKGDVEPALQLVRETLWWIGAPEETEFGEFPLAMGEEPGVNAARFLQLASLEVARWEMSGEPGYRLDRVSFSAAQREGIQNLLTAAGATDTGQGWREIVTSDGGRITICTRYLNDSADFDTLNLLVETLSPEISALVHRLMRDGDFLLLPMAVAASEEAASAIDCDWPHVTVVGSPPALHTLLARGPYHWWRDK